MHLADTLIIAAYMITLVGIGIRVAGRQKTTDSYFIAGRTVPGWAAGLSLLATIITSLTFIAFPGAAYAGDWNLLVPGILFVFVILSIGPIIVPFFRHVVSMSVYEYFGKRFGPGVRMYSSFAFAAGHFAKMGFVFYLLALAVAGFTSWSIAFLIIGLGVITIFYTFIGGLRAVIWTDVVQGFLLWAGIAITLVLLLFSPHAQPAAMFHLLAANHKTSLGSFDFDLARPTFWTMALYGFFYYLQKYTADQTVVQRYLAAKSDRSALRGIAMGASLCLPVWTAFMLIGSLLWAFYRLSGQSLPAAITRADQVFPYYMVTQMPVGVAGLFLAALFGAAMSMLASDLNCLGLILVEDFYSQFFPRNSDAQRLRFGKIAVVLCGFLAIAVALRLSSTHGSALGALLCRHRHRRRRPGWTLSPGLSFAPRRPPRRHRRHRGQPALHRLRHPHARRRQDAQPLSLQLPVERIHHRRLRQSSAPCYWTALRGFFPRAPKPFLKPNTLELACCSQAFQPTIRSTGRYSMNRLQQAVQANGGKTLLGAAVYFYDPIFLEICAHLGYQVIWIEMEHGHITFAEAADLCRMAAGTGMLTMIRIPDVRRENVLKGAECGPDILDVPMIETPEQMQDLREYARFAPAGSRGFFSVSRAVNYSIPSPVVAQQQGLNKDLCLMAQIESSARAGPCRRVGRGPRCRSLHRPRRSRRQPRSAFANIASLNAGSRGKNRQSRPRP